MHLATSRADIQNQLSMHYPMLHALRAANEFSYSLNITKVSAMKVFNLLEMKC